MEFQSALVSLPPSMTNALGKLGAVSSHRVFQDNWIQECKIQPQLEFLSTFSVLNLYPVSVVIYK